ncbi:putative hemolysin-iii channel protein [Diaporthe ampelina]|uniref:Putative hemolysin-iii channel protein n=1 Tax=Diaporthe ampelina TaxID=1214573 RepID=A0A0G2I446_9PEZI|nr:putative hemolysin-iii channel protein [Diaporthe ampelina]
MAVTTSRPDESVNIWSHIIGALIFISLTGFVLTEIPARYHAATAADVVVCSTYFLGVAVCFALSTAFHTLMAHSEAAYLFNMKLDFQGVLILMWAATVPLVYYSFPCDAALRAGYSGLISALAAACSAVTFLPRFSGPHLGPHRAVLFGASLRGGFLGASISSEQAIN